MLCDRCDFDPCQCQKALTVPSTPEQVPQKYFFRKCSNEACTVMTGFLTGSIQGLAECKFCQAGVAHWQRGV